MSIHKYIICIILQIIILFSYSDIVYSGPFGTEMGNKSESFKNLTFLNKNTKEEIFRTHSVPKKHSLFDIYELTFRQSGLAKIVAASFEFSSDDSCVDTLKIYNTVKSQISKKYHNPNIINEHVDYRYKDLGFCFTLNNGKRKHACVWNSNLPDNIKCIFLAIISVNKNTSQVILSYEYNNIAYEFEVKDNADDSDAL